MVRSELKIEIKNKSFFYILPLLEVHNYTNIVQTYLGDLNKDLFENKLYIKCSKLNQDIQFNKNFIEVYEIEDGIMYMLEIPDVFKDDYNHFVSGAYSKMSEMAKKLICKQACKNNLKSPHETQVYGILYKTKARKEELEFKLDVKLSENAELGSVCDYKLEVYDG